MATEYGALLAAGEGGACMPAGRQASRDGENASAGIRVHAGRLDQAQMEALFSQERVGLAIDATHPYAVRGNGQYTGGLQADRRFVPQVYPGRNAGSRRKSGGSAGRTHGSVP